MDAVIFLVVVVALAAFVAAPLYSRVETHEDAGRTELEARRNDMIETLRDLELDRASGLLSPDEHERQRAAIEADLADVMRNLRGD